MLLSRITYPGKEHSLGQVFLEYMTYNLTLAFSEKESPIKSHALPIYSVLNNKHQAESWEKNPFYLFYSVSPI